jgi:N-acetylneuraminic acid mutarotase
MWMFDVETARWLQHTRISGHVPHPRAFHGAVATDENSMYVFGGRYIDDFDVEYRELYKVHHFDIRSGQWSLVGGHPVVTGRYGMEVQYLEKEGKILIYGGQEAAPSATGELFYPEGIRDPTREVIMFVGQRLSTL